VEEIDELHVSASLCDRALVAGARDRLSGRLPEPLGVSAVRWRSLAQMSTTVSPAPIRAPVLAYLWQSAWAESTAAVCASKARRDEARASSCVCRGRQCW